MTEPNAGQSQPRSAPPGDGAADAPVYTTPPPQGGPWAPTGPYADPNAPPAPGPASGAPPPPGHPPPTAYPQPPEPAQAPGPAPQFFGQPGTTAPPATLWWGLASVVTMLGAVSIPEDGSLGLTAYPAWALVMVLAAITTMVPVIAAPMKMKPELAWRIAAGAAGTLVALWVLFTLPSIQQNTALLSTIATVTGVLAVVAAPGRPASFRPGDTNRPDVW